MMKRLTSVSAVFALVVALAACGSDAKKSESTTTKSNATTTSVPEATTTTEEETDATDGTDPEVEMTDEEFATAVQEIQDGVAGANDVCAVGELFAEINDLEPTNAAQVKVLMPALTAVFGKIADTAPADKQAEAAAIRQFAASFEAAAKAANYDPNNIDTFPSDGFNEAMQAFETAVEAC